MASLAMERDSTKTMGDQEAPGLTALSDGILDRMATITKYVLANLLNWYKIERGRKVIRLYLVVVTALLP
jgi:hypothetical protein